MQKGEKYYLKKFEDCYMANFRRISSFAYNYLEDYEQAKNVAQEVFTVLWENREKIDFEQSVLPYLFLICKNKCMNLLDRRKSARNYGEESISSFREMMNINALSHSSFDSIFSEEICHIVHDTVESMPEKIKHTFLLSRRGDLKYADIARLEGISVKTVEYRVSYALKYLRKQLKDYIFLGLPALIVLYLC